MTKRQPYMRKTPASTMIIPATTRQLKTSIRRLTIQENNNVKITIVAIRGWAMLTGMRCNAEKRNRCPITRKIDADDNIRNVRPSCRITL